LEGLEDKSYLRSFKEALENISQNVNAIMNQLSKIVTSAQICLDGFEFESEND
jgi:hypothetical protein